MKIQKFYGIDGAKQATGLTVIIDIFRAGTVAAFLLDKGIVSIIPVSTKEEAFRVKRQNPAVLLVGEEEGLKIPGFDMGNSPHEISFSKHLSGKTAIHRSTKGTQGLVGATKANQVIFGSFVVANAVADYIRTQQPNELSLVTLEDTGSEDDIFADYIISKTENQPTKNFRDIIAYLKTHPNAARFLDSTIPEFPAEDFFLCLDLDRFDFVPLLKGGKLTKG